MTDFPLLEFYEVTTASDMRRLFDQYGMAERIAQCRIDSKMLTATAYHRAFCCTCWLNNYFEQDTNAQVATLHVQEKVGGETLTVIQMFRIEQKVYILTELPTTTI